MIHTSYQFRNKLKITPFIAALAQINTTLTLLHVIYTYLTNESGPLRKPLDASTSKQLQTILEGFLQKGQKLYLETEVDPSLVGGMTVTIGDKFIDMSLKSKIKLYIDILKSAAI
ncbi:ATP synthase subunit O, mitochondrial-like [Saccostrea echinata]|uniref:ATP synthase subunit O, mitochondrial-like n=1 Tax=Saccostrea echinata TaxID=191078 RepID=UPI002A81A24A|nr:ATP synthase subunit O, mitochondrial-like [Saccostrea echinata]